MAAKRLVTFPWTGEFGWELMSWQGFIRKQAEGCDEVVICAPRGHEPLYADFSTRYVAYDRRGVKDCWWAEGSQLNDERTAFWLARAGVIPLRPTRKYELEEQTLVRFGDATKGQPRDILIHARAAIGKRPQHEWPLESWWLLVDELRKRGFTVSAIGTEAHLPRGADDWRDQPLQVLMNNMASAGLVIGPSSGPMHLASLCGAPHLVWTDSQYYSALGGTNRQRYERIWNPFGTSCRVLDKYGWHPSVSVVLEEVLQFMGQLKGAAHACSG